MKTIADKIIRSAIHNGYVRQGQYEEYVYAMQLLLNIFVNDITMLAIGFAMGMILECILFWLVYKALRKYCGGYHFNTALKCYMSSVIMCVFVLLVVKYVPYQPINWGIIAGNSGGALLWLSPVEAVNKPLDEKEFSLFGKIAKGIILLLSMTYAIVCLAKLFVIVKIICLGFFFVALFVVIGKIQLICLKKRNLSESR